MKVNFFSFENMDVAELILEKVRAMELAEQTKNFLEFKISIPNGLAYEIVDEEKSFYIYPIKDDCNKILIKYKNSKWIQTKTSKVLYKLAKMILFQMIRDLIEITDDSLFETTLSIFVYYKNEKLFTDECYILDTIESCDVSISHLNDCNNNDTLQSIQDILIKYIELCVIMDLN